MYIDAVERDDMVLCWYRDDENNLYFMEDDAPYYCYRRNEKNGTHSSMFGDALSKQEFGNIYDYNNYVNKRSGLFESDISPVYKYLSNNFYQTSDVKVNTAFFDIEVDYNLEEGRGYPRPEDPYGKINSMSLYDLRTDKYHLIVLGYDGPIDYPADEDVTIYRCVTERQVLDNFFRVIRDIDILSAWNGDKYDIPYIVERCCKIYGTKKGLKKLCRNGFNIRSYDKTDIYGNEYEHFNLVGRVHIDYMELYKKFEQKEHASYALDSIVKEELEENKLEYKGDLGDLYRTDPKTFFEYSLHDVRLMKMLDVKKKYINLMTMMTKQATMKFTDIFGSIKYLELSVINHCHFDREDKIFLPDKNPDNKKQSFPGGFVFETDAQAASWVSSIDLASLYPSVIRSINISPETHLFQCENNDIDFYKIVEQTDNDINLCYIPTGEEITMKGFEVYNMLREHNFTISAYGSIFDEKEGLIPEILALWYKVRKDTKNKSKEFYKNGDIEQGDYYDMLQNVKKVGLNSLYGAISNPYSRFYSIFLAASVTVTGQIIEKQQAWKANEIIKEAVNG